MSVDTDMHFAEVGLQLWPLIAFFPPDLFPCLVAVTIHLALAVARRLELRARVALKLSCDVGTVLVSAIVVSMIELDQSSPAVIDVSAPRMNLSKSIHFHFFACF